MRAWRTRNCQDCGLPRTLHFNQFGVIDCKITREQVKEAAAFITAFVFFLGLARLQRLGLPLDPRTPIQNMVRLVPATV